MVIMLMAVVQKILTPGYLDGTVNAFWLANGGYFKPLYFFSENWQEVVESNHALLNDYYNETLYRTDNIVLQSPVGNLQLWGFLCTLLILGVEILVPLLFVSKRSQLVRHGALIAMIVIVFLTRQEAGFLCLLCIIGIANCPPGEKRLLSIYLALFGLMQLLFLLDYGYV